MIKRSSIIAATLILIGAPLYQANADDDRVGAYDQTFSAANLHNPIVFQASGGGDQQQALQDAINQAAGSNRPLFIPGGTYYHSGVLTLSGAQVWGSGASTVLIATNENNSAILLTGERPSISMMTTQAAGTSRSNEPNAANILIQHASRALVSHLVIKGAASNGVRGDDSYRGQISKNVVIGTNADGIALMNGSRGNVVTANEVYEAGDDAFSDDSYTWEHTQDADNAFTLNYAHANAYGRGIVAMGAKDDIIEKNVVVCQPWVAIGVGTDSNSNTSQGAGLQIDHNVFYQISNGEPILTNGAANTSVTDNTTLGNPPDVQALLGWKPYEGLVSRWTISPDYIPGTGPGSCNGSAGCKFTPPACFPDKR